MDGWMDGWKLLKLWIIVFLGETFEYSRLINIGKLISRWCKYMLITFGRNINNLISGAVINAYPTVSAHLRWSHLRQLANGWLTRETNNTER